ncbi:MAG: hypothetical protein MHM6MM_004097 [Cercozoa sp. M6MM]
MTRVVLLDVGGVLLKMREDARPRMNQFAREHGFDTFAEMHAAIYKNEIWLKCKAGVCTAQEMMQATIPNVTEANVDAFLRRWRSAHEPPEGMRALVQELAAAPAVTLAILSNYDNTLVDVLEAKLGADLLDHFGDRVYNSYDLQLYKPQPECFSETLKRLRQSLETEEVQVFFVDDKAANVAEARRQGCLGHVLNGNVDELRESLVSHGFLSSTD